MNRFILGSLKQRLVFEDGKNFNYLIKSLQMKHILKSDADARKVKDDA